MLKMKYIAQYPFYLSLVGVKVQAGCLRVCVCIGISIILQLFKRIMHLGCFRVNTRVFVSIIGH